MDSKADIKVWVWRQLADQRKAYVGATSDERCFLRIDWVSQWADALTRYYTAVAEQESLKVQTYWIASGEAWSAMAKWADRQEAQIDKGLVQ